MNFQLLCQLGSRFPAEVYIEFYGVFMLTMRRVGYHILQCVPLFLMHKQNHTNARSCARQFSTILMIFHDNPVQKLREIKRATVCKLKTFWGKSINTCECMMILSALADHCCGSEPAARTANISRCAHYVGKYAWLHILA